MNKIALCTMVFVASVAAFQPAQARDAALKCVAEHTESKWPWRATQPYVPDNTHFRFVCPGLGTRTIPQLYQMDWELIELPFKEPAPGGGLRYVVWLER